MRSSTRTLRWFTIRMEKPARTLSQTSGEVGLGNDEDVVARVVTDYRAPFPDPISARTGDKVSIDESKKTDCPGWVWCTGQSGKSGWVPEAYLERQGDSGHLLCDYDAIELTVQTGEVLTCHKEESGFTWATNRAGQSGWVPSTHVELLHP